VITVPCPGATAAWLNTSFVDVEIGDGETAGVVEAPELTEGAGVAGGEVVALEELTEGAGVAGGEVVALEELTEGAGVAGGEVVALEEVVPVPLVAGITPVMVMVRVKLQVPVSP